MFNKKVPDWVNNKKTNPKPTKKAVDFQPQVLGNAMLVPM